MPFQRMTKAAWSTLRLGINVSQCSRNKDYSSNSPGMVALMPRSADRALRYLHHAGIGEGLPRFGHVPRVGSACRFAAPAETQEREVPGISMTHSSVSPLTVLVDLGVQTATCPETKKQLHKHKTEDSAASFSHSSRLFSALLVFHFLG